MKYSLALSALALASGASAQVGMWGQCGGIGYSGQTNCVAGATCSTLNPYYAQCLSGSGNPTTTTTTARTTTPVTTTTSSRTTTTTSSSRTTTPSSTTSSRTTTTSSTSSRTTTTSSTSSRTTTTSSRTTTGSTTRVTTGPAGGAITLSGNPFAGRTMYANPYYSSEVYSIAIPSMVAAGKPASLTNAAKAVATVPSFVWFDTISKVPTLTGYLDDIRAQRAAGKDIIGTFVVYDLPDRDCAALASNGELSIANNGVKRYETEYIDPLAAIFAQYPDIPVALIIEPDSVANMITNLGVQKCSGAATAYEECINYAVQKLNKPNIAMYLDAGHAGWLGWPDNLSKSGPYFANIYKKAGSPASFRGLATNVANYNAFSISTCPSYTSPNANCDEQKYINAFAPLLRSNGWNAHFVVDQGRSGKQPTGQQQWGDWCNAVGTGFGTRPSSNTGNELVDAFVWIKPGGECDGTSDTSAVRYDGKCGSASSLKPAPEAGQWFQAYFEQLLVNANPSFF